MTAESIIQLTSNAIAVVLRKEVTKFALCQNNHLHSETEDGKAQFTLPLPPGPWKLLGKGNELGEEDCKQIVERRTDLKDHPYKGYEPGRLTVSWNAMQSFTPLLQSLNLPADEVVVLIKAKQ
jgi:hypothetical protein